MTLSIEVDQPGVVLQQYDLIRVYRSTDGASGTYAEITDSSSRLPLVATRAVYEFVDVGGSTAYHYRIDYYSSSTGESSELGPPIRGSQDPSNSVISVSELKRIYLFGLDLTDDNGNEMPDELFEHYIRAAVRQTERNLDIPLRRKVVSDIAPDADDGAFAGDYIKSEWYNFFYVRLPENPIISVESARIVFPSGFVGFDFPREWFRVDKDSGQLWIVPDGTSAGLPGIGLGFAGWLPMAQGTLGFVPGIYRISYTAGFEEIPDDIRHLVAMRAAMGPLNIAGDLIAGAGIASTSVSLDGLSQSIGTTSSATNSGYGARIIQYGKEIKTLEDSIRRYYKGLKIVSA